MAIAAFPFGVGVGNYLYHSLTYVKMSHQVMSHNSYVDLAAEGGVLALFFFGGLVVSLFLATRARNSRWEVTALADNLAIGLRISLIAFLLGATFLSAEVFAPFWWLAGLIAAKALCDRELAEHDQNALAPVR
jgi:O-antigen ligase